MTKFEASGPGVVAWLDGLFANTLPKVGRIALCHHLTTKGGVQGEYTVTRLGENSFYLVSTPRAERLNFDVLSRLLPVDGGVTLTDVTDERGCFTVVGPLARDLLQALTEADLSNAAFPWMSYRSADVGLVDDVRLLRINYEGELGWELYHPMAYQRRLLEDILRVGERLGLRLVGLHALESLRLEKSYRAMYRDMNTELTALESGLERFVKLDKCDFIGRKALVEQRAAGLKRRLTPIAIDTDDASAIMNEGVYKNGRLVGRVSSGGYSYHFGHDLAFALLPSDLWAPGTELEVLVLGALRKARVVEESPYDPTGKRCRM